MSDPAPAVADVVTFGQRTKHGKLDFHPGVKYGFEDPVAGPYFKALGWASDAVGEADVIVTEGELDIDPATVIASGEHRGKTVVEAFDLEIPEVEAE